MHAGVNMLTLKKSIVLLFNDIHFDKYQKSITNKRKSIGVRANWEKRKLSYVYVKDR